jgi:zinc protease
MRLVIMTIFMLLSCQTTCQVRSLTLDNGLKVLVKEDHRAPVAICMIWYNVGAADEPDGLTGISHVLEHLMFKGTTHYPLGGFSQTVASIGGQENALTSHDYTVYYEQVPTQHIELSVELEADRMHQLLFDKQEFVKEMKVIQEERRLRIEDKPRALLFERFLLAAHGTAPYHHPSIGWMSDLHHMQLQNVKTWYQRFYAPNNATLIVVGDVNTATMFALAKKHFGPIKKHSLKEGTSQPESPLLSKKTLIVKSPTKMPMMVMGYSVPTINTTSRNHPMDPYVLEVITGILSPSNSGRLTSSLVQKKQLASHVDVFYNLYARFQTQFILFGTPNPSHTLDELATGMNKELERLQKESVSPMELQRVKKQIIAQKAFEQDSLFNQAMEIGLLEMTGLGGQASENYMEHIKSITPQQIQEVSQRYFHEKTRTQAQLRPEPPHQP